MGHLEVTRMCFKRGANINKADVLGQTPLHTACIIGNIDVVLWLVKKGANINKLDENGSTPLHWACAKGNEAVAQVLIEKGCEVATSNSEGNTSLHLASDSGLQSTVQLILEKDESCINRENNQGWTALNLAIGKGFSVIAKKLIRNGAWDNEEPFKRRKVNQTVSDNIVI
jgi:ankyrin repeat protein